MGSLGELGQVLERLWQRKYLQLVSDLAPTTMGKSRGSGVGDVLISTPSCHTEASIAVAVLGVTLPILLFSPPHPRSFFFFFLASVDKLKVL